MKFEWPWVSRKKAQQDSDRRVGQANAAANREREKLEKEWTEKWHPLLQKAMSLGASRRDHSGDFMLHIGVTRDMLEMAAAHNDPRVWGYLSDQLSYEFRRQISTLNFAGLHRLAAETERRYPPARYASDGPVPWR